MFKCDVCSKTFTDNEKDWVQVAQHGPGEFPVYEIEGRCPHCGSADWKSLHQCVECLEMVDVDSLIDGLCPDCYEECHHVEEGEQAEAVTAASAFLSALPEHIRAERLQFSIWFNRHFNLLVPEAKPCALTVEVLHEAYCMCCINQKPSIQDFYAQLAFGGYLHTHYGIVNCAVRADTFNELDINAQELLIKYSGEENKQQLVRATTKDNDQRTLIINTDVVPAKVKQQAALESVPGFIQDFITNYCFTKDFPHWEQIPKRYRNTPIAAIYTYYEKWYCQEREIPAYAPKPFLQLLKVAGYSRGPGYANGKSGLTVVYDVCIPITEYDLQLSKEHNKGILTLGLESYATNGEIHN